MLSDVITRPCPQYLLLTHKSSYILPVCFVLVHLIDLLDSCSALQTESHHANDCDVTGTTDFIYRCSDLLMGGSESTKW